MDLYLIIIIIIIIYIFTFSDKYGETIISLSALLFFMWKCLVIGNQEMTD